MTIYESWEEICCPTSHEKIKVIRQYRCNSGLAGDNDPSTPQVISETYPCIDISCPYYPEKCHMVQNAYHLSST